MRVEDEFLKQMENLHVPEINPSHQEPVKMAIMNAERSAALGVWLIIVPAYFLFCVCMYYYFHTSWFGSLFEMISQLEKKPGMKLLSPMLLVGLPLVSVIINTLSIIHVQYMQMGVEQRKFNEINITIKLKLRNILLIILSLAIVFVFVAYVIAENFTVRQ